MKVLKRSVKEKKWKKTFKEKTNIILAAKKMNKFDHDKYALNFISSNNNNKT